MSDKDANYKRDGEPLQANVDKRRRTGSNADEAKSGSNFSKPNLISSLLNDNSSESMNATAISSTTTSMEDIIVDRSNQRRSKTACDRCRKRKTKCSGFHPCRSCELVGAECVYPRKAKKVSILDVELEEYQQKIESLQEELDSLKKSQDLKFRQLSVPPPQLKQSTPQISDSVVGSKLILSVWLGSASSELICWNLKEFAKSKIQRKAPFPRSDAKPNSELEISPDFSSFLEETAYDHLLNDYTPGVFTKDITPIKEVLKDVEYVELMQLLDSVVLFINSGYLTVDPGSFREKSKSYFNSSGKFHVNSINNKTNDYFLFKMLMILSLGEIYSRKATLASVNLLPNPLGKTAVPGLKYFKMVVKYIPPTFQLLSIAKANVNDTLQVIELFGLIAMYLRCLDKKQLAVMFTLNALELGVSINLHKANDNEDPNSHHNKIWWATYCLNRFFSSRIGQPLLLTPKEITRSYPGLNDDSKNYTLPPQSNDDFSNSDTMKFYIHLAKIADLITNDLYSFKTPFNNKLYLNSTLRILEKLIDWVDNIPDYLRLKIPTNDNYKTINENNRLIYTLHLNYLHHIYLTCIPILLNFTKAKLISYKKKNDYNEFLDLKTLPKNISHIIIACVNAAQLTINIFMAIYREKLLRIFGFTDLDYLLSSSLIVINCLILKVNVAKQEKLQNYSFEDYLEVAMNLIYEMKLRGNLVAKGKLDQIVDLLVSLHDLFIELGYTRIYQNLSKYSSINNPLLSSNSVVGNGLTPTSNPASPGMAITSNLRGGENYLENANKKPKSMLNPKFIKPNSPHPSKSPMYADPTGELDDFLSFQSITSPQIFNMGVNELLDQFQFGGDGLDSAFLTGPGILNEDVTLLDMSQQQQLNQLHEQQLRQQQNLQALQQMRQQHQQLQQLQPLANQLQSESMTRQIESDGSELFTVTEEDMLFMDQIIQDFQSTSSLNQ